MAAETAPVAGLEIRHGHRWGYSKSGDASVFLDRTEEYGPETTALLIEDAGKTTMVLLSKDASTALFAAVTAARCPHHCPSHTAEVSDAPQEH